MMCQSTEQICRRSVIMVTSMEIAVQGPGAALLMVIADTAARSLCTCSSAATPAVITRTTRPECFESQEQWLALKRHSVMLLPCIATHLPLRYERVRERNALISTRCPIWGCGLKELWSCLWYGWFLEQSFLVWNLFYQGNSWAVREDISVGFFSDI